MAQAPPLGLSEDAPCGLLNTDAMGTVLYANQTFCNWVGHSAAQLAGRRFQDLLTMGGRIFYQTHWAPLLQMQGSVSEVKFEVQHAEGQAIPMVLNAVRRKRDGMVVHDIAAFVARDRDKYERELLRSRQQLQTVLEQEQALRSAAREHAQFAEQMVGIVSHDLRNPLAALHMAIQVLLRDSPTPRQQTLLARGARSIDRANRLVADLLDFTAARVGKGIAVRPRQIDLHQTVADAVEEAQLAHRDLAIHHVREGAVDAACQADPDRLIQAVGNLMSNAVAYGTPGAGITVTSRATPERVGVAVHNLGPTIPQDVAAGLFQPMVRGTEVQASTRSVGLGLFIVAAIAKAHGGAVSVDSGDAGTTFTVDLPRCG